MGSKKGISLQWRMFVPVVLAFWGIIICMGWWQLQRVADLKKNGVYEQLRLIGDRLADLYNHGEDAYAESFITFVNKYYADALDYDAMSIQVRKPNGEVAVSLGGLENVQFDVKKQRKEYGVIGFDSDEVLDLDSPDGKIRYLYYMARTNAGMTVCVFLPYTKEVAHTLSETTTKFWIFFLCVAIFATLFAFLSTQYISRNINILRRFAHDAANDPNFIMQNQTDFPHDELGDISHQIVAIYNQRMMEMQRREHEHQVALHAVEEKNRIKRDLTSNINHELKTPVGVIQGYIDTLCDNPDMDDETRDRFLFKTQENVHRLSALIADVSAITRLESGGKFINVDEVNFHDLVFTFDNFLEENNLLHGKMKFSYVVPMKCKVIGNESLLNAVLLNLVKNAVAYSQGTICRLDLTKEDDDFYYFTFYDDGVGVAAEHLPHMFERFYRVNSGRSRDCGGTGLGLAIVEVTIKSFGGTIDVQNHYPSGLEFNFSLPKFKGKKRS